MNKNRVVWNEGLFLRPQHLQQQEMFLEHWIEGRCRSIRAYSWGFATLEIDEQLLSLGKVAINKASGVFPDGAPFDIPGHTPAPLPYEVKNDQKDMILYLALPMLQPNARVMASKEETDQIPRSARYGINELSVRDLHSENIDCEVDMLVGELNLQLLPETAKLDAYSVISIAKVIECNKDGLIKLDTGFIPSVMHCQATPHLMSVMTEVEGLLRHRGNALAKRIAAPGAGGVAEISDFLLLQLVNRYEPLIQHLKETSSIYPEEVFKLLSSLAGELSTFTLDERRPCELPSYKHKQQQDSFEPVLEEIRRALGKVLETKAIGLEITEHKYGIWLAQINDKNLLDSAMFVLAVNANIDREQIRSKFPNQVTIAAANKIEELVNAHVQGMSLSPLQVAPRQIPYHSGFSYFEINTRHELWQSLHVAGELAVHVGVKLEGLQIELWAIRE